MMDHENESIDYLEIHSVYVEDNMPNLFEYIYHNLNIMKNIFIEEDCSIDEINIYTNNFNKFHNVLACTFKEIPKIDPHIVEQKAKKYPHIQHV